jgi:Nucleotidyltransferase of unknown function (DUF6036)
VTSFDAEQLRSLLAELSSRLEERGVKGEMFLVGGAAMALAYSRRRATADIDAVLSPSRSSMRLPPIWRACTGWTKGG